MSLLIGLCCVPFMAMAEGDFHYTPPPAMKCTILDAITQQPLATLEGKIVREYGNLYSYPEQGVDVVDQGVHLTIHADP